jgi:hypothetical protein
MSFYFYSEIKAKELKLIREREKKWIHMLHNWDKYITRRWKKVRGTGVEKEYHIL